MQNENIRSKKIINALALSFIISLIILIAACSSNSESSDGTTATTTEPPSTVAVAQEPVTTASKNFYHLKIDSTTFVDSFLKKSATFKKIIFNYKINDYANFPGSLTLMGHAAKNNDVIIDNNPDELVISTNNEALSIDNLLYSTMEFRKDSIAKIIGNPLSTNPAHRKRFDTLVFIPDIHTKNGQRHLYYKVQKRPIDPSAQEPTGEMNPCPPFKPNEN